MLYRIQYQVGSNLWTVNVEADTEIQAIDAVLDSVTDYISVITVLK